MLDDNFKLNGQGIAQAIQVANAVVNEITSERAYRKINLAKNWDMYNANHAPYFRQRLDEDNAVFEYRKQNPIIANLVGFSVDLSARYLYGRSSKVTRKFSKNKAANKRMLELTKKADIQNFLLNASKKTAVFGSVLARNVAVDYKTGLQPNGKSTPDTYPHPILLDPLNTWVKRNRWGKIVAVVMDYKIQDYTVNKTKNIRELVVEDSRWMWETQAVSNIGPYVTTNPVADTGQRIDNTYKLSDEFVLLVNNEEMVSDIEGIMELNIALDEALTDKKHFFNKHGWPQLVSEVSLEQVQYSPNKIWEINPDVDDGKKVLDRLGFLTWDGKMADYEKFVKNLERQIFILSNTAAISTGDLEAIGQLRSGAALITAHSVAIHKTEAKQIIWERNETNLFKAMANFDSYLQNTKTDSLFRDLNIEIRFPNDFVPGAEHERAQINQILFNSHLKPLRDILQEEYPEADQDAIEEKYQEIMKDSEDIIDSTREFISQAQGATGKSGTPMQKSKQQTQQ